MNSELLTILSKHFPTASTNKLKSVVGEVKKEMEEELKEEPTPSKSNDGGGIGICMICLEDYGKCEHTKCFFTPPLKDFPEIEKLGTQLDNNSISATLLWEKVNELISGYQAIIKHLESK